MSEVDNKGGVPHKEHTTYPSRYSIGEQVVLDFGPGGVLHNCIVDSVRFEEDKVYYDICVLFNLDIPDEPDGCECTIIRDVDSSFVKDLDIERINATNAN